MGIPHYSRAELKRLSRVFLAEHWNDQLPVDIEEIADLRLSLDIVDIPGLKDSLLDSDAALTVDLKWVYVDPHQRIVNPGRFRFTLAHEVAHLVLHGDYLLTLPLDSEDDWKRYLMETDRLTASHMERDANIFAGYILAPDEPLQDHFDRLCAPQIGPQIQSALRQRLSPAFFVPTAIDKSAEMLSGVFGMTRPAMKICVEQADLVNRLVASLPR